MILCLLLMTFMATAHGVFLPELLTSSRRPFCTQGLRAHGWLLFYYEAGVSLSPAENHVRIDLSASSTRIVLKFCEDRNSLAFPRGDYCVLKGRSSCPDNFQTSNVTHHQPDRFQKSSNFGEMQLCCSTRVSDPIVFPLPPPFALIKKGDRCENIANTTVSEVSMKLNLQTPSSIIDFCYYDRSPCSVNNGGCEQVCYVEHNTVQCDCYSGYSLVGNRFCRMDYTYGTHDKSSTSNLLDRDDNSSPPLFTTSRDYMVMTITMAVVLVLVFIILVILVRCKQLLCVSDCCSTVKSVDFSGSIRSVVRRYSSEREKPVSRPRMSTQQFNRESISAPHVGMVAMDLLNRPKMHASNMHDLPSSSNRVGSYYENSNSVASLTRESIYDSLDRRPQNRVTLQTAQSVQSALYDEPDKEQSVQPLMLPAAEEEQCDNQYYCEPDVEEDVPETPVPAYSPGAPYPPNNGHCSIPPPELAFRYSFSQQYQDPSAKFSHGTLGRKYSRTPSIAIPEGVPRSASVARIAPTPRLANGLNLANPWDNELHKPLSVGIIEHY